MRSGGDSFDFAIVGYGLADIRLQLGRNSLVVQVSYVTDALRDFLRAVERLALQASLVTSVELNREPDATVVVLAAIGNDVIVHVINSDAGGSIDTWKPVPISRLVSAVSTGVDAIDRRAYDENWTTGPFPDDLREALNTLPGQ